MLAVVGLLGILPECPPSACTGVGSSMCPGAASLESKPIFPLGPKNLWFRNAARWPVEILMVESEGEEVARGVLGPDVRRPFAALHGEVWRARALRPGHVGDRRLMLEHRVGAVPLRECNCPQPQFVDCKKPPFVGPRWTPSDPVAFQNQHPAPVDLFWFNGTCEEIISWDEIGGMQPMRQKLIQSTHGHTFRIRSAADGHMLMQHTLDDLVLHGCEEEEERARARDLDALELATAELQQERDALAEGLATHLAKLVLALQSTAVNASSVPAVAVAPYGAATALEKGAAASLLGGAGFTGLLKAQ